MSTSQALSWAAFSRSDPSLSTQVRAVFEQYGRAFGYLATVRRDGGPRVHPVSPVIADGGLFCFVLPSPKRRDLERDGRYALHSYPGEHSEDEAYVAGRAVPVELPRASDLAREHGADDETDWRLFELTISVAVLTLRPRPVSPPEHRVWRAPTLPD